VLKCASHMPIAQFNAIAERLCNNTAR